MLKKILSVLFGCDPSLSFSRAFLNTPEAWFHPKHAYDAYIKECYGHLLSASNFKSPPDILSASNDQLLEFVMVFDQLPYHVHRGDMERIRRFQERAFLLASDLIDSGRFETFTPQEQCFLMLPLRHSKQLEPTQRVYDKVIQLRSQQDCPEYTRFYKATLIDYGKLLNEVSTAPVSGDVDEAFQDILDPVLSKETPWDMHVEVPVIDPANRVFKTVNHYFESLSIGGKQLSAITVSLSGGVDSMVALTIIKQLGIDATAVHIDYGNRDDSYLEAEICKYWCRLLGVPLIVRRIDEIKRVKDDEGQTKDRELYEEVTQRVRLGMYRCIGYPVVLGHNKDDATENILANLGKGQYHDLIRMKELGLHSDPPQLRPLLTVPKSEILELALTLKIPFSHDSTPEWSKRGLIRRTVLPALKALDPNFEQLLHDVSRYLDDRHQERQILISKALIYSDDDTVRGCDIELERVQHFQDYDWQDLFGVYCRHKKLPFPRMKAIRSFVDRLKHAKAGDRMVLHRLFELKIVEPKQKARITVKEDDKTLFELRSQPLVQKSGHQVKERSVEETIDGEFSDMYQRVALFLNKELKPTSLGKMRHMVVDISDGLGAIAVVLMAGRLGIQDYLFVVAPSETDLGGKVHAILRSDGVNISLHTWASKDLKDLKPTSVSAHTLDDYLDPFLESVIAKDGLDTFLRRSPKMSNDKGPQVFVNDSLISIKRLLAELGLSSSNMDRLEALFSDKDEKILKIADHMSKVFVGVGGSLRDLHHRLRA